MWTSFSRCTIPRLSSKPQAALGCTGTVNCAIGLKKKYENVQPRLLPERFVAGSATVVDLGRTEVRWIESDEVAREFESAGAFWFRGGKIIRWQPFGTHSEALEAAGLRK